MLNNPRQPQSNRRKPLRVFQANVGKNFESHATALALAYKSNYDIILLQEPWTLTKGTNGNSATKGHEAYHTFSPVRNWNSKRTRPRVLTLTRKELNAEQTTPALSRDMLWVYVGNITILNFYREPRAMPALETLMNLPIPNDYLVAGDFNARDSL